MVLRKTGKERFCILAVDDKKPLFSLSKENGDFIVQPFRSGGHGGQNVNKVMTACRIIHPASGAVSECQEERSFEQNKKKAFKRLHEKPEFKVWLKKEIAIKTGEQARIEASVEKQMDERFIRVETVENDKWIVKKEE